jgi:hypothetical protein
MSAFCCPDWNAFVDGADLGETYILNSYRFSSDGTTEITSTLPVVRFCPWCAAPKQKVFRDSRIIDPEKCLGYQPYVHHCDHARATSVVDAWQERWAGYESPSTWGL